MMGTCHGVNGRCMQHRLHRKQQSIWCSCTELPLSPSKGTIMQQMRIGCCSMQLAW
jgi:hypothetical protein